LFEFFQVAVILVDKRVASEKNNRGSSLVYYCLEEPLREEYQFRHVSNGQSLLNTFDCKFFSVICELKRLCCEESEE